jgi:hypothetical protein
MTKKTEPEGVGTGAIPARSFRFEIEVEEIGLFKALEPDG